MHPESSANPRIRITWDSGAGEVKELPFVIGVLADLSGMPETPLPRVRYRRFLPVDLASLDELVEACDPRLRFSVENKLSEDSDPGRLNLSLRFRRLEDFEPGQVAHQIKPLDALLELRQKLAELRDNLSNNDALKEHLLKAVSSNEKLDRLKREVRPQPEPPKPKAPPEPGVWSRRTAEPEALPLLEELAAAGPAVRDEGQRERRKDLVKDFVAEVLDGNMTVSRDTETMINARVAQIDHLVSIQLTEVLHHPDFQRLEASWRGLHYLLRATRKAAGVKIKVLNISQKELLAQFQRARERHDDSLSRKVLDQAGGTPGAEPYSLLIGDYSIGRQPDNAELMERMARMGAAAHAPFLASAAPDLLGLDGFGGLADAFRLGHAFDGTEYAKWNSLRAGAESRYIGLVLPRMLLRLPYGRDSAPVESFGFEERGVDTPAGAFLWGSAVWAFAARAAADFDRYGWFGATRGPKDAGEVAGLPVHTYRSDYGLGTAGPTEVSVSDARYVELRSLGLIPLCQEEGSSRAVFFEAWSCHKPRIDPDQDPPTTYESAEIDCVLAAGRIAHYLKCIVRQDRQRFESAQACEDYLRRWAAGYIVPGYAKGSAYAAGFPLLDAQFRMVPPADPEGMWTLIASVLPRRAVGALSHPIEIPIPVALPRALAPDAAAGVTQALTVPAPAGIAPSFAGVSWTEGPCGREQFIRRLFLAETCITDRKLDAAILVLESLAEEIDRHHLDEWESPRLVSHVWDLLRRCYQLTLASPAGDERCAGLLRRICRLDPTRALE